MEAPTVRLVLVEVARQSGWWFYSDKVTPTRGDAGNHGAPLILAFTFKIKNPNPYPIMMDGFSMTVEYDQVKLDEIKLTDVMWIPSGKVNDLRVYSLLDAQSARLNLLVEEGTLLKEKGISLWSAIKKYWTEIPQFKKPVSVADGKVSFTAKNKTKIIFFSAAYTKAPEKKEKGEEEKKAPSS
jgi:hypothetical protein